MDSWTRPTVPSIPGVVSALRLYDTADNQPKKVEIQNSEIGLYVCGITPYDSTHLGHAATYVTFDLIHRLLLDQGARVHFVQNVTDVDDPLFERAQRDQVDWRELGESQINLFRSDMEDLQVIPPREYVGIEESLPEVIEMVSMLEKQGYTYRIEGEYPDIYIRHDATSQFGYESHYDADTMAALFAQRGGDPERPGKKHPLDALLWRMHREGEPSWDSPWGKGRPGWHIECSAIATTRLGAQFAIQGGGVDLCFPHHEFSAQHAEAAFGVDRMARHYVHTGMIGLDGTKMSKSLGNLVFVSHLTAEGHDPAAIRLALYAGHYRQDRDYSSSLLEESEHRLEQWRALSRLWNTYADLTPAIRVLNQLRSLLSDDLDTPAALKYMDDIASSYLGNSENPESVFEKYIDSDKSLDRTVNDTQDAIAPDEFSSYSTAGELYSATCDALLGIKL